MILLLVVDVLSSPLLSEIAADTVVTTPLLQSQGLAQLLDQEALELAQLGGLRLMGIPQVTILPINKKRDLVNND